MRSFFIIFKWQFSSFLNSFQHCEVQNSANETFFTKSFFSKLSWRRSNCCNGYFYSWFNNSNTEKTKNWKMMKKVYLGKTMATQTGKPQFIYDILLTELRFEDEEEYKNFLWMTPENFDVLLGLIAADITNNDTNMCNSIPANVKLAVTIRYLATGDSYFDL